MSAPTASASRRRVLLVVAAVVVVVVLANVLIGKFAAGLQFDIRPSNEDMVHRTLMTSAVLYMLLIAIPFVPAVEVGLVLMALFGPAVAVLVYICTVAGLLASYLVGQLIPLRAVSRLCAELRLRRTAALLEEIAPLDRDARLEFLLRHSPRRVVPTLLRHRHVALMVALNLPGNFVLGGGGGIALTSGLSRLYSTAGFIAAVAIAVAPVPLAVLVLGKEILSG